MSNLDLMRKRIQHNQKKQQEDYIKEYNLRLARKGVSQAAKDKEHKQDYSNS